MTPERKIYLNQCSKQELTIRKLIRFHKSIRKRYKYQMGTLPHFKFKNGKRTFSYRLFSARVAQLNETIKILKSFLPIYNRRATQ